MTARSKRHTGAQSRTAAVRLFARIDCALADPDGLDPESFAKAVGVSRDTIERYVMELVEQGVRLTRTGGAWRYAEGQPRLFTPDAIRIFTR